jgi:hypothetical protein
MRDLWFDEQRFQIYLPPGATYQLHLATRRIEERDKGATPPGKSVVLRSGTHIVTLVASHSDDDDSWTVSATCDGGQEVTIKEPREWNRSPIVDVDPPTVGSRTEQQPTDRRLRIAHTKFRHMATGKRIGDPGPGIELWIEKQQPSASSLAE